MCNKVNILFCVHKDCNDKEIYRNVVGVVECDNNKMRCILKAASLNVLSSIGSSNNEYVITKDKIWDNDMEWSIKLGNGFSFHLFYETYFLNSL